MKRIVIALMLVALASNVSFAAETEVGGTLYTTYMMNLSDGADDANAFSVDRAYVNIKSKLSEHTTVKFTSDLRLQDNLYDIIIKYAFFDWQPAFARKAATLRLGMQPTQYIEFMNELWGHRYVAKMALDEEKYLTTADLGGSIIAGLGQKAKYGSVIASVLNGTSYTEVEEANKQKDINLVAQFKPLADHDLYKRCALVAQVYMGTQNKTMGDTLIIEEIDAEHSDTTLVTVQSEDWKRQLMSVGGLLAYRGTADIGFDLSFATLGRGPIADEVKKSGMTVFGTLYFSELVDSTSILRTIDLFGKLDLIDPNTDKDDDGKTVIVAGVECSPVKGVKASVNFRTTRFQNDDLASQDFIYLNTEIKF
jgi:hypothetical protein